MKFFLAGPGQEGEMVELLDNFCLEARDEAKYVADRDTRDDMKQICEMVAGNYSWSSTESQFLTGIVYLVLESITYLDDKRMFNRALPLICSDQNFGATTVIKTMTERHGRHWLE